MKKIIRIIICLNSLLYAENICAQQTNLFPTNWWIGMKWNKVQILVYNSAKIIKNSEVKINYPGLILNKINRLENERYLALDVTVSATAKPGKVIIILTTDSKIETLEWPLEI